MRGVLFPQVPTAMTDTVAPDGIDAGKRIDADVPLPEGVIVEPVTEVDQM